MTSVEHTVAKDETLFHIGKQYGLNWRLIGHYNNLENLNTIQQGQTLQIPTKTALLSHLVDGLNKWFETKDKTDVMALAVELEGFSRNKMQSHVELQEWAVRNKLPGVDELLCDFETEGKLATLSWFIGEFPGEWRKYLNPETK